MGNFTRSQFGFFGFASDVASGILEEQGDISNMILFYEARRQCCIELPNVQVSDTTEA
jgi:hypothetical protein